MAEENIEVKLDPIAYMKLLMYFLRFSNNQDNSKFAYGLLLGYKNEDKPTEITDFLPIKNSGNTFLDFEEYPEIFNHLEDFNEKYNDDEYPEYILGWARSSKNLGIKTSILDKKNHLYFQGNIYPNSVLIVFNYDNLEFDDGIEILRLDGDFKELNMVSTFNQINWEYSDIFELDDLLNLALKLTISQKSKSILIKDLED